MWLSSFLLDHEDIHQQSFPTAAAETRDKCSLPRLKYKVSWNKDKDVLDYSVVLLASSNMPDLLS